MIFERFVIVGTGRSGTRYASELFSRMGIPCGHQSVFNEKRVDWTAYRDESSAFWGAYIGDSSAFASPIINQLDDKTLIIHQVRNPWRVAMSLFTAKHLPRTEGDGLYGRHVSGVEAYFSYERAAYIWWQWNLMIERALEERPSMFLHVEDYSVTALTKIVNLLGKEFDPKMAEVFKKLDKDIGSVHPRGSIPSLDGLPQGFWTMVDRYGYERPA